MVHVVLTGSCHIKALLVQPETDHEPHCQHVSNGSLLTNVQLIGQKQSQQKQNKTTTITSREHWIQRITFTVISNVACSQQTHRHTRVTAWHWVTQYLRLLSGGKGNNWLQQLLSSLVWPSNFFHSYSSLCFRLSPQKWIFGTYRSETFTSQMPFQSPGGIWFVVTNCI